MFVPGLSSALLSRKISTAAGSRRRTAEDRRVVPVAAVVKHMSRHLGVPVPGRSAHSLSRSGTETAQHACQDG